MKKTICFSNIFTHNILSLKVIHASPFPQKNEGKLNVRTPNCKRGRTYVPINSMTNLNQLPLNQCLKSINVVVKIIYATVVVSYPSHYTKVNYLSTLFYL